jgi:hypothetical protein
MSFSILLINVTRFCIEMKFISFCYYSITVLVYFFTLLLFFFFALKITSITPVVIPNIKNKES